MENLIKVRGLCKKYSDFALEDVNLAVPAGMIVGMIGENGAGKTTTLKAILNVIPYDAGEIRLMGGKPIEPASRKDVAAVFEDMFFYGALNAKKIGRIMKDICAKWDQDTYQSYLKRFDLPDNKANKDLSRGMKTKLNLAVAFAQHPRLLVMDEATSGLDPVVRAEILDLLLEFIQDERCGVLLSTHITTDLERIADQIAYIRKGKMLFQRDKDELLEDMGIVRGSSEQLDALPSNLVIASQKNAMGAAMLVRHPNIIRERMPEMVVDRAGLDDMMQFYAGRVEP